MKETLIITSYFPPEIGAASNRIYHLAKGLKERGHDVSVLTPLPNYPTGKIFKEYRGRFSKTEVDHGIKVHRLWIFATVSKSKVLRLLAMLSYSFSLAWYIAFHRIPQTVIVQSPPLLVAFTAMLLLRSKKRKLILNVSDLWPVAGLELGALKKNLSYRLLEKIESFNYNAAHTVLGQSEEILAHIRTSYPEKKLVLYRNYPDFESSDDRIHDGASTGKLKLVYAGLLGVAQGILKLCQHLEFSQIELHIYGSGAEQNKIESFIKDHPNLPIYFHGRVTREELHHVLPKYNVVLIPLLNRIYGSVPSKIFEYAKLGLPIIYFGGGEGEDLVSKFNLGWVAKAGDYDYLNFVISKINKEKLNSEFRKRIKETADSQFDFNVQLDRIIEHFQ